jgi:hypothetical protein
MVHTSSVLAPVPQLQGKAVLAMFGGFSTSSPGGQNFQIPRHPGVRLEEKGPQSNTGRDVAVAFEQAWVDFYNSKPSVQIVYSIHLPRDVLENYEKNKNRLDNSGRLRTMSVYWGGQCVCDIGAHGPAQTCLKPSCAICMVINNRFEKFAFGDRFLLGSRGKGLYAHANPAQADHHVTSTTTSNFRAMVMCDLDFDGKNQDKIVDKQTGSVFVDSAAGITPKFLILYQKPPPQFGP